MSCEKFNKLPLYESILYNLLLGTSTTNKTIDGVSQNVVYSNFSLVISVFNQWNKIIKWFSTSYHRFVLHKYTLKSI